MDPHFRSLNASIGFDKRLVHEDIEGSCAWVEGLERAGKRLTRDGLIKAMEGIRDYDAKGVFLGISYGPNNRAGTEAVVLVENRGGKQQIISDWIQ